MKTKAKYVVMVCTEARGGMRSVVDSYRLSGLFERWNILLLTSHVEGGILIRLLRAGIAFYRFFALLASNQVEMVHCHSAMRGSFWRKSIFALTSRIFSVPSIMHLHGSEMRTFYGSLSPFSRFIVRWIFEHVNAVIVLSESWRQFLSEIAPAARIIIINNYVAIPGFVTDSVSRDTKNYSVLFLGLLGYRKGIYDLLEAWPSVINKIPDARLRVGGNGELVAAKNKAESLGISNSIEFLGWVDGKNKDVILRTADVFILPSYNEGMPISILEAMSMAMPVVATRVGGIPEMLSDQVEGVLINPGDKHAMSDALIKLGTDTEYRCRLGQAARLRIINHFSEKAVLPQLESLYREVLKDRVRM